MSSKLLRFSSPSSLLLPFLVLGSVVVIAASAEAVQVFHSPNDDGVAGASVEAGSAQSVFLYVDGGGMPSLTGTPCHDGDGDEVCAFTVELSGLGPLSFGSFIPDTGADVLANLASGRVVLNGLDPVAPGAGPQRIGELIIDASVGGEIELSRGEAVGADLSSELLATQTLVTVPEPGALATLAAGGMLLARLYRTRRRQ